MAMENANENKNLGGEQRISENLSNWRSFLHHAQNVENYSDLKK